MSLECIIGTQWLGALSQVALLQDKIQSVCVCVKERESVKESVCECVCVCERVCESVCVGGAAAGQDPAAPSRLLYEKIIELNPLW